MPFCHPPLKEVSPGVLTGRPSLSAVDDPHPPIRVSVVKGRRLRAQPGERLPQHPRSGGALPGLPAETGHWLSPGCPGKAGGRLRRAGRPRTAACTPFRRMPPNKTPQGLQDGTGMPQAGLDTALPQQTQGLAPDRPEEYGPPQRRRNALLVAGTRLGTGLRPPPVASGRPAGRGPSRNAAGLGPDVAPPRDEPPGPGAWALDLGEVRPVVSTDGLAVVVITARALRAVHRHTHKRLADLRQVQVAKVKGSLPGADCSAAGIAS